MMLVVSWRRIAVVAAVLLALWIAGSGIVAAVLTSRGSSLTEDASHRITTSDGENLGAWFERGDPAQPCILLLHGNGASRTSMRSVFEMWSRDRYCVLAISMRAHGDSTGELNDFGYSARHDVVAAVAFLEREAPGRPIIVSGRSMGAAAAIFASRDLGDRVGGYFLEQPYRDLESATWNRIRLFLPDPLGWPAYIGLSLWASILLPTSIEAISPADHARHIAAPAVLITGSADDRATLDDVRAVHRNLPHAQLIVFDGARHVALDEFDLQRYRESFRTLTISVGDATSPN